MMDLKQALTRSIAEECGPVRLVVSNRTLGNVLAEIAAVGPIIWTNAVCSEEVEQKAIDTLDELQAEARALIEQLTGCSWEVIQAGCL
jgi:hypothetical protein